MIENERRPSWVISGLRAAQWAVGLRNAPRAQSFVTIFLPIVKDFTSCQAVFLSFAVSGLFIICGKLKSTTSKKRKRVHGGVCLFRRFKA